MYYWWDPTYILVVIGAIICLIASARVKTTYAKYSKIPQYVRTDRSTGGGADLTRCRHL